METKKKSIDLVVFQQRLNESMGKIDELENYSSLLAFKVGSTNYLLNLQDLKEVEGVPPPDSIVSIALTKNWVLGVVNYKGYVYTLVDLQKFLGGEATVQSMDARSLVLNNRFLLQCALVVPEIYGLVSINDLEEVAHKGSNAWSTKTYKTKDQKVWEFLDIKALTESRELLDVELT